MDIYIKTKSCQLKFINTKDIKLNFWPYQDLFGMSIISC